MEPKSDRKAILGWALYDFANTIFSMNVISRYFPLWVTEDNNAPDIYYSAALSLSMLLVALSVPVLGAISDQTGRRSRPLTAVTVGCVLATAAISAAPSLLAGLALFVVANYCYQAAIVFYDSLLPSVARGSSVSRVAGYGVSLGYAGAIAGLLAVMPVYEAYGRQATFLPTAALFFIFALPCFAWVRDGKDGASVVRVDIASGFRKVAATFMEIRKRRDLFVFLLANFLILDGVNTVIAFMSIYAKKVIGLEGGQLTFFLVMSTVGAAVGALFWGWASARFGPHKTLQGVCGLWIFTLVLAAVSRGRGEFWAVGPLAGLSMGGIWVCGRVMIVSLSEPGMIGECFGFFNLAGKFASILGPLAWGAIVAVFAPLGGTIQHRLAVLSLALFIGAGWILLRRVRTA